MFDPDMGACKAQLRTFYLALLRPALTLRNAASAQARKPGVVEHCPKAENLPVKLSCRRGLVAMYTNA